MTKQIVIKLNEKKFRPLINKLKASERISKSDSEIVGKILFGAHMLMSEKLPELDNKTRIEYLMKKRDATFEQGILYMSELYAKFIKTGKLPF